jgi:DNA repair protein RecN (Recombination protein N)
MINYLKIKNLGLIDEVNIDLHSNLNALTGETGAGKTMVLSAIDALLGKKIPNSLISDKDQTLIESEIFIDQPELINKILELDLLLEDNCLIVSRSFTKEGKSKCLIGGRTVPAALLGELMSDLIFVHGQKDQQKISRSNHAISAIDEYLGNDHLAQVAIHGQHFRELIELEKQLKDFQDDLAKKEQDREKIQQMIDDIKEVSPQPDEDIAIVHQLKNLHLSEKINQALLITSELAREETLDPFNKSAKALSLIAADDPSFAQVNDELLNLLNQINAISSTAQKLLLDFSQQEQDVDALEARRAKLNRIIKLYGPTLAEVIEKQAQGELTIMKINDPGDFLRQLQEKITQKQQTLSVLSKQLSKSRQSAAIDLSKLVTSELKSLMMAEAEFVVRHETVDLKNTGIDDFEFTFRANNRLEFGPINKIASGGELSRLMLALEVVMAKKKFKQTMIFDEIDTGVGGKAAIEIGKRLRALSKVAQVILVTHLPQIAAFADLHLVVERDLKNNSKSALVRKLDSDNRKLEVSRMLAGLEGSETALGHAEELINLAQAQ